MQPFVCWSFVHHLLSVRCNYISSFSKNVRQPTNLAKSIIVSFCFITTSAISGTAILILILGDCFIFGPDSRRNSGCRRAPHLNASMALPPSDPELCYSHSPTRLLTGLCVELTYHGISAALAELETGNRSLMSFLPRCYLTPVGPRL